MYEDQTYEKIRDRLLSRVSPTVDRREGSVIYDATAPAAAEFMLLYATLDYFFKNTFGDTADREYLIKRALERGLSPYQATRATVRAEMTPRDVEVPIGARFSYDTLFYEVIEKMDAGFYLLECETEGTEGNIYEGRLIPVNTIKNLQDAQIISVIQAGENEEDTESFRERYLKSFSSQAYGGNVQDYKEKVNAIPGVGGVKVYPVWQGGGTVRIVFMTSDFRVPEPEFVAQVQEKIDPVPYHQQGLGIAPIGHWVTVQGVRNSEVKIDLDMVFTKNHVFEDYRKEIEKIIDDYFKELNKKWEKTQTVEVGNIGNEGIVIKRVILESRLLGIEGVTDIHHVFLNDKEENLTLGTDELAVRGPLNGTA